MRMLKWPALLLAAVFLLTACGGPAQSGPPAGTTKAAGTAVSGSETQATAGPGETLGTGEGTAGGQTAAPGVKPTSGPANSRNPVSGNRTQSVQTQTPSTATTKGGGIDWGSAGSAKLLLRAPAHGGYAASAKPTFSWSDVKAAKSYTFTLQEKSGSTYRQVKKVEGLTKTSYTLDTALKANTDYQWKVTAVTDKGTVAHYGSNTGGNVFMYNDPKNHPANKGLHFSFDGKISEEVLKNYLSRSMTLSMIGAPSSNNDSDARLIFNTGAKYIARSIIPWQAETEYENSIAGYKKRIDELHAIDPDLIFETCIFETVWKSCEKVAIPDWVFKAFGQPVEKRNFSYDKMRFADGWQQNQWGNGASTPDITQLETQMYFYYRACRYIDAGFECIHWGQVMLMSRNDPDFSSYQKLINMVRSYAKTHARRHFVLNNAHTHGMKGPDGKLIMDFHGFPLRAKVDASLPAHAPAEGNPQLATLEVGYLDGIYKHSMGGQTYSGWSCSSLPYFVELDNFGGGGTKLNDPSSKYQMWGMDEISWFANQPASYRHEWLEYAYKWVRSTDPAGSLMMPGSRPVTLQKLAHLGDLADNTYYYANNRQFLPEGFSDEDAIRAIWVNGR